MLIITLFGIKLKSRHQGRAGGVGAVAGVGFLPEDPFLEDFGMYYCAPLSFSGQQ